MRPLATISTLFLAANLLNARSVITDTFCGKPKTVDTTPGDVTIRFEAQLMTNPIQNLVLDPLRVIRIPVSRDRVTTVRFPSPISDFVSAAVATELHPEAKFLLLPQPGKAFFSLQALSSNASTTLNVVWKSQTFVFELVESSKPWLSVSFLAPETTNTSRARFRPQNIYATNVWCQFIETSKEIHQRKLSSYANVTGVESLKTGGLVKHDKYSCDIQDALYFRNDEVLVLRIVFENQSQEALRFNTSGTTFLAEGRSITYLASDFDGVLIPKKSVVAYFIAHSPKYAPRNSNKVDTINVNVPLADGYSQNPAENGDNPATLRAYTHRYYMNH